MFPFTIWIIKLYKHTFLWGRVKSVTFTRFRRNIYCYLLDGIFFLVIIAAAT